MRRKYLQRLLVLLFVLGFIPAVFVFFLPPTEVGAIHLIILLVRCLWSAALLAHPLARGKLFIESETEPFWSLLHLQPLWLGAVLGQYFFNFLFIGIEHWQVGFRVLLVRILQFVLLLIISSLAMLIHFTQQKHVRGEIHESAEE